MRPIVFLHIPKTAGQTIHSALAKMVGQSHVSPVRVNEQAIDGAHYPEGYRLYSGHLDWTDLAKVQGDPFVFTVLRDPMERLASFFLYIRDTARKADAETLKSRFGLQRMLEWSTDDYFFGGDDRWQGFIRNHYYNFYCSFFATHQMDGRFWIEKLSVDEVLAKATENARSIKHIYDVNNLAALESDIRGVYGARIKVVGRYSNPGSLPANERRWPIFYQLFESDRNQRRIEEFVQDDQRLLGRLSGLGLLR